MFRNFKKGTAAAIVLAAVSCVSVFAEGTVREYSIGELELKYNDVTGEFSGTKAASFSKDGLPLASESGYEVVIPDSINGTTLKSIPKNGFYDCDRITSIKLPSKLESIGEKAFLGCDRLESIAIPNSVTTLDTDIFESCDNLAAATVGSGINAVPDKLFYSCKSLTDVELPDTIKTIGSSAFEGCKAMQTIELPDALEELGVGCFKDCSSLTDIVIPEGIKKIPTNAFSGCKSLRNITLPEGLSSIDKNAFADCISLKSISIGENCRSIDKTSFSGCSNLTIACVDGSKASLYAISNNFDTTDYEEGSLYTDEDKDTSTSNVQTDENNYTYTDGSAGISLNVNGKYVDCGTAEPVIQNGTTLVPMRPLLTAIGCKNITWDAETKTLKCSVDDVTLQMTIDNDTASVNGANVKLSVAPQIINSSTYVPARFISEAFGLKVSWDAETKTVIIK